MWFGLVGVADRPVSTFRWTSNCLGEKKRLCNSLSIISQNSLEQDSILKGFKVLLKSQDPPFCFFFWFPDSEVNNLALTFFFVRQTAFRSDWAQQKCFLLKSRTTSEVWLHATHSGSSQKVKKKIPITFTLWKITKQNLYALLFYFWQYWNICLIETVMKELF